MRSQRLALYTSIGNQLKRTVRLRGGQNAALMPEIRCQTAQTRSKVGAVQPIKKFFDQTNFCRHRNSNRSFVLKQYSTDLSYHNLPNCHRARRYFRIQLKISQCQKTIAGAPAQHATKTCTSRYDRKSSKAFLKKAYHKSVQHG